VQLRLEDEDLHGEIRMVGKDLQVAPEAVGDGVFFVVVDKAKLHHRKNKITIGVYSGNRKIDKISTNFVAPNN
jgi:hypothetical protein